MSPNGNLALSISELGDVTIAIVGRDQFSRRYTRTGVIFCTCTNGGGMSVHTRRALILLADAIEKDNRETPDPRGDVCARCNGEGYAGRAEFRRLCRDCGGDGKVDAGGFHTTRPCPTCGGRGRMAAQADRDAMALPCPACKGSGKQTPVEPGGPVDRAVLSCQTCNGTGRADRVFSVSNVGDPCGTCAGKGIVDSGAPGPDDRGIDVSCPTCDGTGRNLLHADDGLADPCSRCHGSGKDPASSIGLRFNCTACNGTGTQGPPFFEECPDCNGHGCDHGHVDDGAPEPPECSRCNGTGKVEAFAPHDDEKPATVGMNGGRCLEEIDLEVHRARGERDPCPECDGTGKRSR